MRLILPVGFIALALGAYSWIWFATADRLEGRFGSWVEARRAEGLEVGTGRSRVTGFPYRLNLTVEDLRVAGQQDRRRWAWQAQTLRIHALPLQSSHVILELDGLVSLTREEDTARGTRIVRTEGVPGSARASLVWTGDALARIAVDIQNLTGHRERLLRGPDRTLETPRRMPFEAARLQLHTIDGAGTDGPSAPSGVSRRLILRSDRIAWSGTVLPALGETIARAEARLILTGLPDQMLRRQGLLSRDSFRAWRANSGTVHVDGLEVDWSPVRLDATGTMTLDRRGRPQGSLDVTVTNLAEAVDGLAQGGLLDHAMATLAGSALTSLGAETGTGHGGAGDGATGHENRRNEDRRDQDGRDQDGRDQDRGQAGKAENALVLPLELGNGFVTVAGARVARIGSVLPAEELENNPPGGPQDAPKEDKTAPETPEP